MLQKIAKNDQNVKLRILHQFGETMKEEVVVAHLILWFHSKYDDILTMHMYFARQGVDDLVHAKHIESY